MNTISSTSERIWYVACALVFLAYVLTVPRSWQCEGVDEIEYLGLAHSIVLGQGYTLYGEPYGYYPPVFSALLSVVMRWDLTAFRLMYVVNAAAGFAGLVCLATWLRARYGRAGRWAAWFALVAYYPWSFSTRYLLAEQLFVLFSSVALVELDRVLRAEKISARSIAVVAGLLLLSAMTKASTIALAATVGLACGLQWLRTRKRRVAILGLVALALAGGFMVAWELRSQLVAPNAVESYGRWVLKWLGLSKETVGLVAQNLGEGTVGRTTLFERTVIAGSRLGQYVTSVVRVPPNFLPLGLLLSCVILVGLLRELRARPWSPPAWYTLVTLAMICLTSWVSSYHRYLYPLTPLLFYFLLSGASALRDYRRCAIGCGVFGVFGLLWTWRNGLMPAGEGIELIYMIALGVCCLLFYVALLGAGLSGVRKTVSSLLAYEGALAAIVLALALHNAALAAQRFRLSLQDSTPRERNLEGAIACGKWIKSTTPPAACCAASFPRLFAFLADRPVRAPEYDDAGRLDTRAVDYVVTIGALRGIPSFRAEPESALQAALDRTSLVPVFASGDARVYKCPRID